MKLYYIRYVKNTYKNDRTTILYPLFFSIKDIADFSKATEKLATGILTIYQPSLEKVKENLNELT